MDDDTLLATHDMSASTAACNRCGFNYALIIEQRIACGDGPAGRRRGRPPKGRNLQPSQPGDRYGWLRVVVSPEVRNKAIESAKEQDITLSEVVRRALSVHLGDRTVGGWGEQDVREAITAVAQTWTRKPIELEGSLIVFGMSPQMVDDLIQELYKRGRRVGREK